MMFLSVFLICAPVLLVQHTLGSSVVQLTETNVDDVLSQSELVFVDFYAEWCRFSHILMPVFEEASNKVAELFPDSSKVVFAKVDCDRESGLAMRYHISKYPTLKLFHYGQLLKREYRGQRSTEAIVQYIQEQLKDPVVEKGSIVEVDSILDDKRKIIAFLESKTSDTYKNVMKAAALTRGECQWYTVFGEASATRRTNGDVLEFRPELGGGQNDVFSDLANLDALSKYVAAKCIPLVRDLTFENAEELTEEGLPFLILFMNPDDKPTRTAFVQAIQREIADEKGNVNCLVADGIKFAHPLHHLGKSQADLPVLAIDSFKHMYLFPSDVKQGLETPGLLKTFIDDLHSGKLHREFHNGPDPVKPASQVGHHQSDHIPKNAGTDEHQEHPHGSGGTPVPESTFKKLAPSHNRYTLLRDEL